MGIQANLDNRWEIWHHSVPQATGKNLYNTWSDEQTAIDIFNQLPTYYSPELWRISFIDGVRTCTLLAEKGN